MIKAFLILSEALVAFGALLIPFGLMETVVHGFTTAKTMLLVAILCILQFIIVQYIKSLLEKRNG